MTLESKIPRFSYFQSTPLCPEQKVVQLEVDGQPYLRAGKGFHAEILVDFALECRRVGEGLLPDDELQRIWESADIPSEGERYRAVGMGKAEFDFVAKKALFYGASETYELRINPEHLQQLAAFLSEWTFEIKEEE